MSALQGLLRKWMTFVKKGWGDPTHVGAITVTASTVDKPSDYHCDGIADDVEINAALNALPAGGGKVQLSEGTFTLTAPITRAIDNVIFEGHGAATIVNYTAGAPAFNSNGQANWSIINILIGTGSSIPTAVMTGGQALALPQPITANISRATITISQSYERLSPAVATTDTGTVTAADATTMTDSAQSGVWLLNHYAGYYLVVTGAASVYGTVASNTTTGVITLDANGWRDKSGNSASAPATTLPYFLVSPTATLITIAGGVGAQQLYLTIANTLPSYLPITVTIKTGVDNIFSSDGSDVVMATGQSVVLYRDPDTNNWYIPLGGGGSIQHTTKKTITFTGASGLGLAGVAVPVFTVSGTVLVRWILGECTADLTQAQATATITLGVTGNTSLFTGVTNSTSLTAAAPFWVGTTGRTGGSNLTATTNQDMVINANVIITPATQNTNGGSLDIYAVWEPISAGATLA